MPRKKKDKSAIHAAMARLAIDEREFLSAEFLAPVVSRGLVAVRIAGVYVRMRIASRDFEGFGVFQPHSHADATLVRVATLSERRRYLCLFPSVHLVVSEKEDGATRAVPLNIADTRFGIENEVDVLLCEDVHRFDTVCARFDGAHFWFDEPDPRADPAVAPYLRHCLTLRRPAGVLDRPALLPGHRTAYARAHRRVMLRERVSHEGRLKGALAHAGADLHDFVERHDNYRVTFDVDGRRHVSVVRKDDLTVQSAGICLSGRDRDFDLGSLVGVLREAR